MEHAMGCVYDAAMDACPASVVCLVLAWRVRVAHGVAVLCVWRVRGADTGAPYKALESKVEG